MKLFKPKNSIYKNWNKDLYIASKLTVEYDDYNNEIVKYDKPFFFGKVNYQPLSRKDLEAYIQAYGETKNDTVSCLINYTDDNIIKELDLAYLYGNTPDNESENGNNANYVVRSYKPQNTKIMVIFESIVKEEN